MCSAFACTFVSSSNTTIIPINTSSSTFKISVILVAIHGLMCSSCIFFVSIATRRASCTAFFFPPFVVVPTVAVDAVAYVARENG